MRGARFTVIVGLVMCVAGCSSGKAKTSGSNSHRSASSTTVPTALSDREVLQRVSWQAGDLRASFHPVLFGGGDQVVDEVTLDLCGASFPSEQRRTARHQVGVNGAKQHDAGISIEAVLYDAPAGAAEAMREVRAAKAHCPSGYVPSDVAGVPPLRYRFATAPDATWNRVPGIDRFAVAATVNDQHGHADQEEAVYQQRGRVLVVLYAADPKTTASALTHSLEVFTEILAHRMASLPATAVDNSAGTV